MEDRILPKAQLDDYYYDFNLFNYWEDMKAFLRDPNLPEPVKPPLDPVLYARALERFHEVNDRHMLNQLRWTRMVRGLSQGTLARLMNKTQQAISKTDSQDWDPRLSTVRAYANAVGLQVTHELTILGDFEPFWPLIEADRKALEALDEE